MNDPRRLPFHGLVFVLYGQSMMTLAATSLALQLVFLSASVATVGLSFVPWRLSISADRARIFFTVGIVGYVIYGFSQTDMMALGRPIGRSGIDFLTGLVIVFTVHQLGALLRLGRGGGAGPLYVGSAIHALGAANQPSDPRIFALLVGWMTCAMVTAWRLGAPPQASARRRFMTRSTVLGLATFVTLGVALTVGLPRLQQYVDSLNLQSSSGLGTSGFQIQSASLGTVRLMKLTGDPVLRMRSTLGAGTYLRGMTYPRFVNTPRWQSWKASELDIFASARKIPGEPIAHDRKRFTVRHPAADVDLATAEILLEPGFAAVSRVAPGALVAITAAAAEERLRVDTAGILLVPALDSEAGFRRYTCSVDASALASGRADEGVHLDGEALWEYAGDGVELPAIVRTLADEICGNESDPRRQAARIAAWLAHDGGFTYSLEVGGDPDRPYLIEDFLAPGGRQGWCEYFATAMVLMMRARGVPCRYVTGYVAGEWNAVAEHYVVRNWDAHAWVEVHVEGQGWLTYDPTPPAMRRVEGGDTTGWLAAWWDWLVLALRDLAEAISSGQWRTLLVEALSRLVTSIARFVTSPLGATLCLLGLALYAGVIARRRRRRRRGNAQTAQPTETPGVTALRRVWQGVVARAEAAGVGATPGDTPRRLAARLAQRGLGPDPRALAELVDLIYATRYRGRDPDLDAVAALAERLASRASGTRAPSPG